MWTCRSCAFAGDDEHQVAEHCSRTGHLVSRLQSRVAGAIGRGVGDAATGGLWGAYERYLAAVERRPTVPSGTDDAAVL